MVTTDTHAYATEEERWMAVTRLDSAADGNRLTLVQERTRILRRLEFMADMVVSLSSTADDLETITPSPGDAHKLASAVVKLREVVARTLAEIKSMAEPAAPFSAMVSAWLEDFRAQLAT